MSAPPLAHPLIPELLTVRQTAGLLNVCERIVWLLAKQRILPPVRIRGCTRWRRSDVMQYIANLAAHDAEKARAT
jgi:hypothetical protein